MGDWKINFLHKINGLLLHIISTHINEKKLVIKFINDALWHILSVIMTKLIKTYLNKTKDTLYVYT